MVNTTMTEQTEVPSFNTKSFAQDTMNYGVVNMANEKTENKVQKASPETSLDAIHITGLKQVFNENTGKKTLFDKVPFIGRIFRYKPKKEYRLFDNFEFVVPNFQSTGQIISIMGGSGCGKSYLLRIIAGLNTPQAGDIKIYGKTQKEYGHVPMVFQQYSSYDWMTALDNVALPMVVKGKSWKDARKEAEKILCNFGLCEHMDKYAKPGVLSGGQLQRISVARCIAANPKLLLLDEATGALDIRMKREVQDMLLNLYYAGDTDLTILNVTHSVEEALYLSNRIIVLQAKPCTIYKTIDIHYPGESQTNRRGKWIFNTQEYVNYSRELTATLDEACF